MTRIAFIGVGNMGHGMAANQVKAGRDVWAFDLAPAALEHATEAGCRPAASIAEAVREADAVITMLPARTCGRPSTRTCCPTPGPGPF